MCCAVSGINTAYTPSHHCSARRRGKPKVDLQPGAGREVPGCCPPPHHPSMACCLHCTALHESFCLPCWVVVTQLALHNNCGAMCVIIRLAGNGSGVRRQNKFPGMRAWLTNASNLKQLRDFHTFRFSNASFLPVASINWLQSSAAYLWSGANL